MNPDSRYRPPYPSKSPTPTRETEGSGTSRTHVYVDDETLQRMIESFGPLDYSQFAATMSPQEGYGALVDQDPFSAMGWHPELSWASQEASRRRSKSPRPETSSVSPHKYLMDQAAAAEEESNPHAAEAKKQTLMEWFDRSIEHELDKRRDIGAVPATTPASPDPALAALKAKHALNLSKGAVERIAETSASRIEIAARLETDFTTELTDAAEKFAKAEAMSKYTEALLAAEAAAKNAPPEEMETAAAVGARVAQRKLMTIKETIPGPRPIEVIGYVGVTKPTYPKKS